jgi:UDP-glucose/GDP-mannose dehydrogenase family, NAD binding domain
VEEAADHVVAGSTHVGSTRVQLRLAPAGTRQSNPNTREEPLAVSSIRWLNSRRSGVNGIRNPLEHYFMSYDRKIAVIGLDCVGLPMAAAFARAGSPVIGFDIDAERVRERRAGPDSGGRCRRPQMRNAGFNLRQGCARGADFSSTLYRPRSMLPLGPIWVPCLRSRAAPVGQEIAVGGK